MGLALEQAFEAGAAGEVPIGAVVVRGGAVVGRGRNQTEHRQSPVAHAELIALESAAAVIGQWRLSDSVLVVSVEPCTMCAGAALLSRVDTVVFGAREPKTGALGSLYDVSLACPERIRPRVIGGVREEESLTLMQRFFAGVRGRG
jgi:tRNA(adenine34) deaminase